MDAIGHSVEVHSFRCFDVNVGDVIVPPFKATRGAIVNRFGGEVLPFTGETVAQSELDDEGRWFRIATGWGSLS